LYSTCSSSLCIYNLNEYILDFFNEHLTLNGHLLCFYWDPN
jgi:hypothetical protein